MDASDRISVKLLSWKGPNGTTQFRVATSDALQEAMAEISGRDGKVPAGFEIRDVPLDYVRPVAFVSMGRSGGAGATVAYDASAESEIQPRVVVIDETKTDEQGSEVDIDAQDGTTYVARLKELMITSTHFDAARVQDLAGENVWANNYRAAEGPKP